MKKVEDFMLWYFNDRNCYNEYSQLLKKKGKNVTLKDIETIAIKRSKEFVNAPFNDESGYTEFNKSEINDVVIEIVNDIMNEE